MASQPEVSETSSTLQRLIRNRDFSSFFVPLVLGFSNNLERQDLEQQQDQSNNNNNNNRVILINPFTQGMVVIDGTSSLDSLLRQLGSNADKDGQPPASRSAIETLPRVEISSEEEGCRGECAICLEEFCGGGFAKEMPCKHRFHGDCLDKWLGIHGTCPVCRFQMPFDKDESESKIRSSQREVWVTFSFNRNNNGTSHGDDEEEESSGSSDVADHDSNVGEARS